jgi:hypothetical protein
LHQSYGERSRYDAAAYFVDPLGFDAGDSNLYRYVNNAPTNATDPSGLQQQGTSSAGAKAPSASQQGLMMELAISEFAAGRGGKGEKLDKGGYVSVVSIGSQQAAVYYKTETISVPTYKETKLSKQQVTQQLDAIAQAQDKAMRAAALTAPFAPLSLESSRNPSIMVVQKGGSGVLFSYKGNINETIKVPYYVGFWGKTATLQSIVQFNNDNYNSSQNFWANDARAVPLWGAAMTFDDGIIASNKGDNVEGAGLMMMGTGQMMLDMVLVGSAASATAKLATAARLPGTATLSSTGGSLAGGTAQNLTKQQAIQALRQSGTAQAGAIANALESGQIGLNSLGDELFNQMIRTSVGDNALTRMGGNSIPQMYLRRADPRYLSTLVEEGTHALDMLNPARNGVGRWSWEIRGYYYARQFELASGLTPQFQTLPQMLQHIRSNYGNDIIYIIH